MAVSPAGACLDYIGERWWVENPTATLWRSRLGAATTRSHIFLVGDSIAEATGLTGWAARLRSELTRIYGDGGAGFVPLVSEEWAFSGFFGADWSTETQTAAYRKAPFAQRYCANSTTKIATWTKPAAVTVTSFDIFYVDRSGTTANWQYSIDGGGWTNAGAATAADNGLKKISVASAVTASVRVRPNTGQTVSLAGIATYNGTSGLLVHRIMGDGTAINPGVLGLVSLYPGGSGDGMAIWDEYDPVLTVLALGQVDSGVYASDTPTTFGTSYQAVIDRLQTYGDVIVLGPGDASPVEDQATYGNEPYIEKVRAICKADDVPYLIAYDVLGDYADALAAGYMADGTHWSQAGQDKIAGLISRLLRIA